MSNIRQDIISTLWGGLLPIAALELGLSWSKYHPSFGLACTTALSGVAGAGIARKLFEDHERAGGIIGATAGFTLYTAAYIGGESNIEIRTRPPEQQKPTSTSWQERTGNEPKILATSWEDWTREQLAKQSTAKSQSPALA